MMSIRHLLSSFLVVFFGLLLFYYSSTQWSFKTIWDSVSGVSESEDQYSFICEWLDPISRSIRHLRVNFFPIDNSVDMFDLQNKKVFLKRIHMPNLEERDLYVGNTIVILSRQLRITKYGDTFTENEITLKRQKTFAMIKPDAIHRLGEIVELVERKGFEISNMKMAQLTRLQAMEFYHEHHSQPFYEDLVSYITSSPVVAIELLGSEAVSSWRKTLGPTDSNLARSEAPHSLRAQFGTDKRENAAHGSDSLVSASRELNFFFSSTQIPSLIKTACRFENSTCCIVKPHAIRSGILGRILSAIIDGGFKITALELFRLRKEQAEEFLEVYDGVLPYYQRMVQQLISGPIVALEVTSQGGDSTPETFRKFVGPMDPDVAKELRPESLRARFGEDKVLNAIHCSDLPEDAKSEVEYFFKILQEPHQ